MGEGIGGDAGPEFESPGAWGTTQRIGNVGVVYRCARGRGRHEAASTHTISTPTHINPLFKTICLSFGYSTSLPSSSPLPVRARTCWDERGSK